MYSLSLHFVHFQLTSAVANSLVIYILTATNNCLSLFLITDLGISSGMSECLKFSRPQAEVLMFNKHQHTDKIEATQSTEKVLYFVVVKRKENVN